MHATTIDGTQVREGGLTAEAGTRRTVTAYLDALAGDGDFGRFLTEDATFATMGSEEIVRGREAVVGTIDWLHKETFAGRPVVKTTFFADGRAAIEADFVGTHVGEFAGIAPTGRPIRVPYSVFYDLVGDEIATIRVYISMDAIRRQIGAA
jgi:hypothetical protein